MKYFYDIIQRQIDNFLLDLGLENSVNIDDFKRESKISLPSYFILFIAIQIYIQLEISQK